MDKVEEVTVIDWEARTSNRALQEQIDMVNAKMLMPIVNTEQELAHILAESFYAEIVSTEEFDPTAGDIGPEYKKTANFFANRLSRR
jgi:hypothetical protein